MGAWEDPIEREKAVRLLSTAVQDLIRTAADMQSRNVDTKPLTEPVLRIQQAIALLSEQSESTTPTATSDGDGAESNAESQSAESSRFS